VALPDRCNLRFRHELTATRLLKAFSDRGARLSIDRNNGCPDIFSYRQNHRRNRVLILVPEFTRFGYGSFEKPYHAIYLTSLRPALLSIPEILSHNATAISGWKSLCLSCGTSLERIAAESRTQGECCFVHYDG
jgi:hypothetical protein